MTIGFNEFLNGILTQPALAITVLLTTGVILVNGWTDAPNAIATAISTRSIKPKTAIIMAAVFNFIGVFVMTMVNASVAATIANMVDFSGNSQAALVALSAALFAIVSWATAAWYFGIPTSKSHTLIAGVTGAAIALQGGISGINGAEWIKVVYGLILSTFLGFGSGWISVKVTEFFFYKFDRRKSNRFFKRAQVAGAAAMAFMHGAQDGQKFMGVFMLGMFLAKGNPAVTNFQIHVWVMFYASIVMGVGTSIGGYRIIKAVGMDMVKLEKYQGFAADFSAAFCLLLSSLYSIPVSTTHTKTTAIMGVGAAKRPSTINWSIGKDMVLV